MSDTGRNAVGSCLTIMVTIGVIISLLIIIGIGVMVLTVKAGA